MGMPSALTPNDLDLILLIWGYIWELVNLAKCQCPMILVDRGCFGNCNRHEKDITKEVPQILLK